MVDIPRFVLPVFLAVKTLERHSVTSELSAENIFSTPFITLT